MPTNRVRSIRFGAVVISGVLLGSTAFAYAGPVDPGLVVVANVPPHLESTSTSTTVAALGAIEDAPRDAASTEVIDPGWIEVNATGDVVFDYESLPVLRQQGFPYAFDGIGELFVRDDLTIVNLECTPSVLGVPIDKQFVFRCPISALPVAHQFGVDVVNLANNHSQDFGSAAMLDGVLQARLAGLTPVGVGADLAAASRPGMFDINGRSVAVIGMGGVVPNPSWLATSDKPGMASGDDLEQMVASVSAAAEMADLVLVTIHWGVEGESQPRQDDRDRAAALIDAGADAIFGHHPHRLGELEWISGAPVFWTLGNFIWPRQTDASATTAVAHVAFSPEGDVIACLLPAFIESGGQPKLLGSTDCDPAQ